MAFDFLLNMIWLPIGVVRTYGFRSAHDAFLTTCESFDTVLLFVLNHH